VTDAEVFLGDLSKSGYKIITDDDDADGPSDVVVVNTCGFIEEAKRASVSAIMEAANAGSRVVVTGCLAQRYGEELADLLPEVSDVVGFEHYKDLPDRLNKLGWSPKVAVGSPTVPFRKESHRIRLGSAHSAYVRLGEGCDHACTFCAIPGFRGKLRSKPWDQALEEIKSLSTQNDGALREIVLIAEDTNQYGIDFGENDSRRLSHLLNEINGIVPWIRLLYCYPSYFTDDLIQSIASLPSVCKYLDMPLQHISNTILKAMRRPSKIHTTTLIEKLQDRIPGLKLRTTFIVGFPGETDEDHRELCNFVKETRFHRAGFFTFSREDGTPAADYDDQVPEDVKEKRRDELIAIQQTIEEEEAVKMIGQNIEVLVDSVENGSCVGRTRYDAPEIDGTVQILTEYPVGTRLLCQVIGNSAMDLYVEVVRVIQAAVMEGSKTQPREVSIAV